MTRACATASSRPSSCGSSPADRVAQVLELEPVRVDGLELDPFHLVSPPQLDDRRAAVPRVVEEERSFRADHLQLVP